MMTGCSRSECKVLMSRDYAAAKEDKGQIMGGGGGGDVVVKGDEDERKGDVRQTAGELTAEAPG
jgi:hypothetical protein